MGDHKNIRKVAIIGGGPKGLYGFERLTAWLKIYPPSAITEIHIYNRSDSFGAGENYRTGQPSYLLMNNPVGEINMWGDQKPPPVVPQPLSFTDWSHQITGLKPSNHDFTTRAMAGRYLSHGFHLIVANLPGNVRVKCIVGEVVDILNDAGKYSLRLNAKGLEGQQRRTDRYDHILLATGHPRHKETKQALALRSFAEQHEKAGFIPFVYPAETVFSDVPPNCTIAIKGMGLTFADAVLALTEGKGGRFTRDEGSDKLIYTPSGKEPKVIYPFSRSGLPMIPRISVTNEIKDLSFFTRSALQRLSAGEKLDFKRQIWPLLKQDMIHAYYHVAMKNAGYPGGLSNCHDFEDVERLIAEYHDKHPSEIQFDAEQFLDPLPDSSVHMGRTHHEFVRSLYRDYLQEARKGELRSPLAAVTAVWRHATSQFCDMYAFGGLTPKSQRDFDGSMRGKLHRVTFGPPVKTAEKLYTLMETGILNFDSARNPDLILDDQGGSFILQSESKTRYPAQYLVDARIPGFNLVDDPGPLFGNLLKRGLITIYENRFGTDAYQPGAINITRQGFVMDKDGRVNPQIAVTGTPTEGITFDNETLSRVRNNFVDGWAEFIGREYAKSEPEQYAK